MNTKLASKLGKLIGQLVEIQREINELDEKPTFPESKIKLIENRICLTCGKHVPVGKRYLRGNDENCRQDQQRGGRSESELISLGLLAPLGKTGRKKQSKTEIAVEAAKELLATEQSKAARKKNN